MAWPHTPSASAEGDDAPRPSLRPAQKSDFSNLLDFTSTLTHVHRHLDWRDSLDWVGRQPFWLQEENGKIQAALCCVPEPDTVAWVRMFAVAMQADPDRAWQNLFARCLDDLRQMHLLPAIVSLSLRQWYDDLLKRNGFQHHQDIVVFLYDKEPPPPPRIDPRFHLREMQAGDMPGIQRIDNIAFEPIWQLSAGDLTYAAKRSMFTTVIEQDGEIVAYQMSSGSGLYAHLARLAVRPDLQGQKLGYALVQHLLDHFINGRDYWGVTLNTQHNNTASLRLYHRIGFQETGEKFPVYIYPM